MRQCEKGKVCGRERRRIRVGRERRKALEREREGENVSWREREEVL